VLCLLAPAGAADVKTHNHKMIMARKINFQTENQQQTIEGEKHEIDFGVITDIMDRKYPDKMLFDLKTVSAELNCSYEFIRMRTDNGVIKCIKLGVNKMIPRSEFIKLLTVGV